MSGQEARMRSAKTTYRFSTPEVTDTPFIAFFCEVVLCLTVRRYWVPPSVTLGPQADTIFHIDNVAVRVLLVSVRGKRARKV